LIEALSRLGRRQGGRLLAEVLDAQPGYVRAEVARLLPELAVPKDDPIRGPLEGWARGRLFDAVREVLVGLAARGPVALVVEDVHWADRTTLDFLRFMVGDGASCPVPLAMSCRGDEPLAWSLSGDWVAAVCSVPAVTRITLEALSSSDSADQVESLLGHRPAPATLEGLYRRTEGNPFFVEQLLATGSFSDLEGAAVVTGSAMPQGLATLLRARASRTSHVARQVLGALAVAGRPLDEAMLTAVSGLTFEAVEDGLIELIEARLVTGDERGEHRPRHALLGEVVAADLLASRRQRLHARTAEALANRHGNRFAAEVAAHWAAAGSTEWELAWSATAAYAAEHVHAFTEAATHWERVTQLWAQVDAPPAGLRLADAYVHAIDARYFCGDSPRAGDLTEEALGRIGDEDDPYERAVLLYRASISRRPTSLEAGLVAAEDSVRLFSSLPASRERAAALGRLGALLGLSSRGDEALAAISEGLRVSGELGSPDLQACAHVDLARHELLYGSLPQRGLDLLARAAELGKDSTDLETVLLIAVQRTDTLLRVGDLSAAHLVGAHALDRVRSLGGASHQVASILASNVAEALLGLGRSSDAEGLIFPMTQGWPTLDDWSIHQLRVRLDVARGHLDQAWDRLGAVRGLVPTNLDYALEIGQDVADVACWRRRPDDALPDLLTTLERVAGSPFSRGAGPLLVAAMRAHADLAERARARRNGQEEAQALAGGDRLLVLHRDLQSDPFGDHPLVATAGADRASWRAERHRLHGTAGVTLWEDAARAWQGCGRPHSTAYALWRQAEALLVRSDQRQAEAVLRQAFPLAAEMAPLRMRILAVARRARIDIGPVAQEPRAVDVNPYGLTDRERHVLRLLTQGRTNNEIGAALFMSPKTASVHVTHILRKLGVSGRVQAATLAERAGLVDDLGGPEFDDP